MSLPPVAVGVKGGDGPLLSAWYNNKGLNLVLKLLWKDWSLFDLDKFTGRYLGEKQVRGSQIYKYITPSCVFIQLGSLFLRKKRFEQNAGAGTSLSLHQGFPASFLLLRAAEPDEGSRFL